MQITFLQTFGAHQAGSTLDLPDNVANIFIRVGVAKLPATTPPISKSEAYKPRKGVSRAVKK
jgi:hypothetical protein